MRDITLAVADNGTSFSPGCAWFMCLVGRDRDERAHDRCPRGWRHEARWQIGSAQATVVTMARRQPGKCARNGRGELAFRNVDQQRRTTARTTPRVYC